MENKKIVAVCLVIGSVILTLSACNDRNNTASSLPQPAENEYHNIESSEYVEGEELLCLADSEEEAKRIADMIPVKIATICMLFLMQQALQK